MTKKNIIIAILVVGLVPAAIFYFKQQEDGQAIENEVAGQAAESIDNNEVVVEQNEEVLATTTEVNKEKEATTPVAQKPVLDTSTSANIETTPEVISDPAPEPVKPSGITMAEVRTHADASSCYSVIDGAVYDLTAYIPKHPGGKGEILAICGTDGSSAFSGQHEGESKPERILASYKIGLLAK